MYEVKYRNSKGQVITALVGAQTLQLAVAMVKLFDIGFKDLIQGRNTYGEVFIVKTV